MVCSTNHSVSRVVSGEIQLNFSDVTRPGQKCVTTTPEDMTRNQLLLNTKLGGKVTAPTMRKPFM